MDKRKYILIYNNSDVGKYRHLFMLFEKRYTFPYQYDIFNKHWKNYFPCVMFIFKFSH